jgi:hypothetical protein
MLDFGGECEGFRGSSRRWFGFALEVDRPRERDTVMNEAALFLSVSSSSQWDDARITLSRKKKQGDGEKNMEKMYNIGENHMRGQYYEWGGKSNMKSTEPHT